MYLKKHLPFFLLLLAGMIIVAVMIQPEQEVAEQETDSKAVMAEQGENIQETESVAAMSGNMSPAVIFRDVPGHNISSGKYFPV